MKRIIMMAAALAVCVALDAQNTNTQRALEQSQQAVE